MQLSFDLVLGYDLLDSVVRLVKACPDTRFILDHCAYGNPDWYDPAGAHDATLLAQRQTWERGVAALAALRNVVCKISGIAEQTRRPPTAERLAPVANYCIEQFGEDRVMFGSNWPVCLRSIALADWVARCGRSQPRAERASRRKCFMTMR